MIPRFSFFRYVDEIKELIADNFPILQTVSFSPSEDGDDAKYSDVGVPAFLMTFQAPDFIDDFPMRDVEVEGGGVNNKDGYFADIRVNVQGSLLLPRFQTTGQNEDDLNMSIAVFQAMTNIAALLHAKARGWNCSKAIIGSMRYEPDENYHVGIIEWGHTAVVGREDGTPAGFGQGLGRFLKDLDLSRDLEFITPSLAIEDTGIPDSGEIHVVYFRWYVYNIETLDELPDFADAETGIIYVVDDTSWVKGNTALEEIESDDYDSTYYKDVDIDESKFTTDDITVTHMAGETTTTIEINLNIDGVGTFDMPTPTVVGEKVEIVVKANAIVEGNVETKHVYTSNASLEWEVSDV